MKLRTRHLLMASVLASSPAWAQKEAIPYYNPGEDITTVTSVVDATYTTSCTPWAVYTIGIGNAANQAFSYVPGYRGNFNWDAGGTLWTKALDVKDGHAYKVTFVMGATFNGLNSSLVQPYTEQNVALYATPNYKAAQTEIYRQKGVGPFDTSNRPTYTAYFKGDTSKPYLGFGNRGGGNVSRFNVDDIRVTEVDVNTPNPATGLTASAEGRTVAISFTLPQKSVIDEQLSGIASVRLLRNGILIKEWTGQTPGAAISYTDNVNSAGQYTYTVVCGNNGSYGEPVSATVSVALGNNAVTPTQNTEYGVDNSKPNGYYGRNYNARAIYLPGEGIRITYAYPLYAYKVEEIPEGEDITTGTVSRMSDGKVLLENSTAGEVTDTDIDENERTLHQYMVDLKRYDYNTTAYSSIVSLNNPMPFIPALGKMALDEFNYYDADGDMNTWSYANGNNSTSLKYRDVGDYFSCSASSREAGGDDWLISPGVLVEEGKTYRVDIDAFCADIIEKMVQFSVGAGKSNDASAITAEIMPLAKLKHQDARTYSAYYTADYSGNAFFGIRAYQGAGTLGISNIQIYEVDEQLPAAIEELHVAYSATPGHATLSFNAPAKNINGGALTAVEKVELYRNGILTDTFANPEPGELLSKEITFEIGSQDEYMAIPYTTAGSGLSTKASVMVLEAPYSNTFDNAADITGFTIIDPEESGYTWSYMATNKAMRSFPDRATGHNDYLITPPVHLEEGYFYKLDFLTWLASPDHDKYYDNKIEVLIGTAPTAEAMTTTIIAPTGVYGNASSKTQPKEWFSVPSTGEYYIAWHSIAAPGMGQELYIDDVNISAKIPGTYPDGVSDFTVTPDPEGATQAEISYKIPATDLNGNPLTGTVYNTVLYRDGVQLISQSSQQPGTEIGYTDTRVPQGVHTYTVTCFAYDSENRTPVATRDRDLEVYIGINKPAPVEFVTAVENPEKYGEVTISWGAPLSDADGYPLNTTDINYTIGRYIIDNYTGESRTITYATGVTAGADGKLEWVVPNVLGNNEEQQFMRFYVLPYTKAGSASTAILSRYVAVGPPFTLPYKESFSNSNSQHSMLQDYPWPGYSMASWGFGYENPTTGVQPVDGDNGLLVMRSEWSEQGVRLYTPRITLDKENPVMTFYVYNQSVSGRIDNNELGICVREGNGEFVTVSNKTIDEWAGNRPGWQKAVVDLKDYAGKTVYVGLDGRGYDMTFIHVDKITIDNPADVDLALTALTTDRVYVGTEHNIRAFVKNNGAKTVESANVALKLDGKSIAKSTVENIEPGEEKTVVFTNTLGREDVGTHVYTAMVGVADDADKIDNYSIEVHFAMIDNSFPTVENLSGTSDADGVTLSWEAPVLPEEPVVITDTFEQYPSWSTIHTGIGDYTLIDNDNKPVGGFTDLELPNIPLQSRQSFTLWDFTLDGFDFENSPYKAHSGNKCLVSIYNVLDGSLAYTDDRLISPLLTGEAQTISFYARAITDQYPDEFTVYYSKDGISFDDFRKNAFDEETVGGTWTKFSYDLPEGTKYFMIRHWCGNGRFFFLDDLTYKPVGEETLQLKGYNVYRGNDKMTEAPIAATSCKDTEAVIGSNSYAVSAVYDRGESPLTEVSVEMSGVDGIAHGVSVTAENGAIVIRGAEGLDFSVVSVSGMVLTQRKAAEVTRVAVEPGIYVVTVDGKIVKLAVR